MFMTSKQSLQVIQQSLVLLTVPFLSLSGCNSASTTSQSTSTTVSPASTASNEGIAGRFALIMNGPPTDKSWNQKAYEAAQALKAKGVDTVVSES
ncbi:BMP family ABC transporter substrate-binding protein, partial [Leptolyngbya sp. FACHB-238]|nr:BMP family ABC transporter substrate-binding protein [Leptolyngbya sp. FACHB-238]